MPPLERRVLVGSTSLSTDTYKYQSSPFKAPLAQDDDLLGAGRVVSMRGNDGTRAHLGSRREMIVRTFYGMLLDTIEGRGIPTIEGWCWAGKYVSSPLEAWNK